MLEDDLALNRVSGEKRPGRGCGGVSTSIHKFGILFIFPGVCVIDFCLLIL